MDLPQENKQLEEDFHLLKIKLSRVEQDMEIIKVLLRQIIERQQSSPEVTVFRT